MDDPSGRFAQAASAGVSQTNDDGTDTIHQQRSGNDLASRTNLLRLKEIMTVGSRRLALQDSSGKRQEWISLEVENIVKFPVFWKLMCTLKIEIVSDR